MNYWLLILANLAFWIFIFARSSRHRPPKIEDRQSDGILHVVKFDGKKVFQLEIITPPEVLERHDDVNLTVVHRGPEPGEFDPDL